MTPRKLTAVRSTDEIRTCLVDVLLEAGVQYRATAQVDLASYGDHDRLPPDELFCDGEPHGDRVSAELAGDTLGDHRRPGLADGAHGILRGEPWRPRGPGGRMAEGPKASDQRSPRTGGVDRHQALLDGPAAAWAEDQRWTLARVAKLIGRMFHVSYSLKGVALLLHRLGWTPQVPIHRAAERDDDAVAAWRKRAPRGHTPVVAVTAKGSGRISIAAMTCYKAGEKSRLIYRMMLHRGRKGEKKGFREHDFAALLDAAHQQLGGPIVLVWDNLGGHTSALMRRLVTIRTQGSVAAVSALSPRCDWLEPRHRGDRYCVGGVRIPRIPFFIERWVSPLRAELLDCTPIRIRPTCGMPCASTSGTLTSSGSAVQWPPQQPCGPRPRSSNPARSNVAP